MVATKKITKAPIRSATTFNSVDSESMDWENRVEERESFESPTTDYAEQRWASHQERLHAFVKEQQEKSESDRSVVYEYAQPFGSPSRVATEEDVDEPLAMDSKTRKGSKRFRWEKEESPARMTIKDTTPEASEAPEAPEAHKSAVVVESAKSVEAPASRRSRTRARDNSIRVSKDHDHHHDDHWHVDTYFWGGVFLAVLVLAALWLLLAPGYSSRTPRGGAKLEGGAVEIVAEIAPAVTAVVPAVPHGLDVAASMALQMAAPYS